MLSTDEWVEATRAALLGDDAPAVPFRQACLPEYRRRLLAVYHAIAGWPPERTAPLHPFRKAAEVAFEVEAVEPWLMALDELERRVSTVAAEPAWYDLSPQWAWLQGLATERLDQKRSYTSHRPWNEQSDFIGLCGELVWSVLSGQMFDVTLRPEGDGGYDFPGLDVKASPYWQSPHLLHPVNAKHWPAWFALVGIDVERQRGRVLGVATAAALRATTPRDFGHGPQHCLPVSALEPPSAYLRTQRVGP